MELNRKKILENNSKSIYSKEFLKLLVNLHLEKYLIQLENGEKNNDYKPLFLNKLKEIVDRRIIELINTPIYFTLDELVEIQSSDDPFNDDEIYSIMCDELERSDYEDINTDVVDYCLDWLNKN